MCFIKISITIQPTCSFLRIFIQKTRAGKAKQSPRRKPLHNHLTNLLVLKNIYTIDQSKPAKIVTETTPLHNHPTHLLVLKNIYTIDQSKRIKQSQNELPTKHIRTDLTDRMTTPYNLPISTSIIDRKKSQQTRMKQSSFLCHMG